MTAPCIALRGAAFGWHGRPAVHGLAGEFSRGSMAAIVGPNGAGKSTLLKGLAGVLRPLAGALECEADLRRRLAWLPQASELERGFPITVADMVALGAWGRVGAWRRFDAAETARVHAALRRVGLQDLAGQSLGALSGGQMQRALFARLLLQDAPLLLLDEPFSAIDAATTDVLLALLRGWGGGSRGPCCWRGGRWPGARPARRWAMPTWRVPAGWPCGRRHDTG